MLITSLNENFLTQLQREKRQNSVLDLYITNKPSQVKSIYNVPNISDHEGTILVDSNIRPLFTRKKTHTYHLFSKADWPAIKEDISKFSTNFQKSHSQDAGENWTSTKSAINTAVNKHPSQHAKRGPCGAHLGFAGLYGPQIAQVPPIWGPSGIAQMGPI